MPYHDLFVSIVALGGVLGLIWLVQRWLLRGRGLMPGLARPGAGRLRLVQSLALDPRRRVVLVACDGQEFAVLTGGANDILLGRIDPEPAK